MDDPGWSWPAWKFGMKRADLFTKLHDEYNTITTPIQDPEAFHHDVYEISNAASNKTEFLSMLADRKAQRLNELNHGLELAAVKIISNPNLIGTDQWGLAIQLFRARSLDALVSYFSSYLPGCDDESDAETVDSRSVRSGMSSSTSTSVSTVDTDLASDVHHSTTIFSGKITHEPLSITTSLPQNRGPLSPPSSDEDSLAASPISEAEESQDEHYIANRIPIPASRSMSFSGSESDRLPPYHRDDLDLHAATPSSSIDDTESIHEEQPDDYDTPCDPAEIEGLDCSQPDDTPFEESVSPMDNTESDTPTPRPNISSATYFSAQIAAHLRRSPSPASRTRLAHSEARKSPRMRRREPSPHVSRSPCEVLGRIQKPLHHAVRSRPQGRRRVEME